MREQYLTREQVREVDHRAMKEYGMPGLVLMENAGRGCADFLCHQGVIGPVAICCGKGNNGGDGFVVARHLDARGYDVRVLLCCDPVELTGDAAANYRTIEAAGLPISVCLDGDYESWLAEQLAGVDWIVDALLGTGARGEPRPPLNVVLRKMNERDAKKVAIDLPSGLDCDTGTSAASTFRADHTCTFVAAKAGFRAANARTFLGVVHVVDIGVPGKLLREYLGDEHTTPTGP